MSISTFIPAMIGCDNNHPFFIKIRFAILNRLPNPFDLIISFHDIVIEELTVSFDMPGIIRIPQIDPT